MKHQKNASSMEEMRMHPLYRKYPKRGVENVGAPEGYFDNLWMYCGGMGRHNPEWIALHTKYDTSFKFIFC